MPKLCYAAVQQKKGKLQSGGYTIIETMIFLAVTGALLMAAFAVMSGQQARTRFSQSVRELDTTVQAILNEVESGFYPNSASYTCTVSGGKPNPVESNSPVGQGTNGPCIFLGKVLYLATPDPDRYSIVTVAGRRLEGSFPVASIAQAGPTAVIKRQQGDRSPDLSVNAQMPGGLAVTRVYQVRGGTLDDMGALGFFSTLTATANGDPLSGSHNVTLTAVPESSLDDSAQEIFSSIGGVIDADRNPDQVVICLTDSLNGNGRSAALSIGGQGGELNTEVFIDNSVSSAPGGGC